MYDGFVWTPRALNSPTWRFWALAVYEASIYPLLKPHQRVFLVPGAFATHKADPPPDPGDCAKCPADKPHQYGNSGAGVYCCPTAATNSCGAHGAKTPECCLEPGSGEGCQGVARCGSNPANRSACHSGGGGGAYAKGNATFCYGGDKPGTGTFVGCDEYMADQARAFAKWATADKRVAGFAPWHWDSRTIPEVSPYKEVGVVDMPLTKAAWKEIGQMVRENAMASRRRGGGL